MMRDEIKAIIQDYIEGECSEQRALVLITAIVYRPEGEQ